jgi:daunorubicin resistance ABC transporter ATP-binding subunit
MAAPATTSFAAEEPAAPWESVRGRWAVPPAIRLHDVCKVFASGRGRKFLAIDHLTLDVPQGQVFGLLGPNGSGKTTTVNMISGLVPPSSGSISILGKDIRRHRQQILRRLGTVPQETALYDELTAWTNMEFHADLYGVPRAQKRERITRLLELVNLLDRKDSRVATFSGGMKRRLAIARALLHEPRLVYLDEPTLGVDVQARAAIWQYVRDLRSEGKTVLITTNYLEEAQALCDRLAIIDHGRLVAVDTPDHLRQTHGGSVISIVVRLGRGAQLAIEHLHRLDGVSDVTVEQEGTPGPEPTAGLTESYVVRLVTRGASNHLARIVNILSRECEILDIAVRESNLDEVFLQLTGKVLRD